MSYSHLESAEYQGLGRTQMHDAAIDAELVPGPEILPTTDEVNTERAEQFAEARRIDPHFEHANKSLDELDELEDEIDESELRKMRAKRLKELKNAESNEKNALVALKELQDHQFDVDVKQASSHGPVVLLLFSPNNPESSMMERMLTSLQTAFRHISFVKLRASDRIANFPLSDVPTVLVWNGGQRIAQFVRLAAFAGSWTTLDMVEFEFGKLGILESRVKDNPYDGILERERQKISMNVKHKGNQIRHISRDSDSDSD